MLSVAYGTRRSPPPPRLVRVLSAAGDVIDVDDIASALQLDRTAAAQRLSRWTEQGWLRRVGRGAYVAASIDTMGSDRVLDDPWYSSPRSSRRHISAGAQRPSIGGFTLGLSYKP